MMIKGQLYYYTLDDPSKSRLARDLRTAEKMEEYYLYASSDAVLCYTYYIKFIINRGSNIIPILFHNKNKKIPLNFSNYEKLFDIQVSDMSTKVSTNSSIDTYSYKSTGSISISTVFNMAHTQMNKSSS